MSASVAASAPLHLPKHPDEHRPQRPVLLAIDQEFREGAVLKCSRLPLEAGSLRL